MINHRIASFALIAFTLAGAGCSHKQKIRTEDNQITDNKWISIQADWIKEKGAKYDIEFKMRNDSDKDIIILLADMHCFKGAQEGVLKHTFFNTGERTIDFRKGQAKSFRLVCRYPEKDAGRARIVINRIFDNPDGDGATKGKEVAKNIEWSIASKEE